MNTIKKLEWIENAAYNPVAFVPFGYYHIDQHLETYRALFAGCSDTGLVAFGGIEECKEKCQIHFESIVNECLEP